MKLVDELIKAELIGPSANGHLVTKAVQNMSILSADTSDEALGKAILYVYIRKTYSYLSSAF